MLLICYCCYGALLLSFAIWKLRICLWQASPYCFTRFSLVLVETTWVGWAPSISNILATASSLFPPSPQFLPCFPAYTIWLSTVNLERCWLKVVVLYVAAAVEYNYWVLLLYLVLFFPRSCFSSEVWSTWNPCLKRYLPTMDCMVQVPSRWRISLVCKGAANYYYPEWWRIRIFLCIILKKSLSISLHFPARPMGHLILSNITVCYFSVFAMMLSCISNTNMAELVYFLTFDVHCHKLWHSVRGLTGLNRRLGLHSYACWRRRCFSRCRVPAICHNFNWLTDTIWLNECKIYLNHTSVFKNLWFLFPMLGKCPNSKTRPSITSQISSW